MPPKRFTKEEERAIRDVGRTLRKAREAQGIKGTQLAAAAGISTHTLYRAELGYVNEGGVQKIRRPEPDTIMGLSKLLGLDGPALCEKLGLTVPYHWRAPNLDAAVSPPTEFGLEGAIRQAAQLLATLEAMRLR